MRLIRDVLDNQLVDRNSVKIGKADGIIVEIEDSGSPRVLYIETGLPAKARRIHPALGKFVARWASSYRIPWSRVRNVGIDIDVDLDAERTPLLKVEDRLRDILTKLPFS